MALMAMRRPLSPVEIFAVILFFSLPQNNLNGDLDDAPF
jgi:hypothetical protein